MNERFKKVNGLIFCKSLTFVTLDDPFFLIKDAREYKSVRWMDVKFRCILNILYIIQCLYAS